MKRNNRVFFYVQVGFVLTPPSYYVLLPHKHHLLPLINYSFQKVKENTGRGCTVLNLRLFISHIYIYIGRSPSAVLYIIYGPPSPLYIITLETTSDRTKTPLDKTPPSKK